MIRLAVIFRPLAMRRIYGNNNMAGWCWGTGKLSAQLTKKRRCPNLKGKSHEIPLVK